MYARLALEQDIPNIVDLINSHEYMYGINLKESGLQEKQIQIISRTYIRLVVQLVNFYIQDSLKLMT